MSYFKGFFSTQSPGKTVGREAVLNMYRVNDDERELLQEIYECVRCGSTELLLNSKSEKLFSKEKYLYIYKYAIACAGSEGVVYDTSQYTIGNSLCAKHLYLSKNNFSGNMIAKYSNKLDNIIDDIGIYKIEDKFEQVKEIYDYFLKNITYDGTDFLKSHSAWGAIMDGRAVCEGISNAFANALNRIGINCITVGGEGESKSGKDEDHMWNILQIGSNCYHVDVTYGLTNPFENKRLIYDYFLISDDEICVNHKWKYDNLPKCTAGGYDYFRRNGLFCDSEIQLKQAITNQVRKDEGTIYLKFSRKFATSTSKDKVIEISAEIIEKWLAAGFRYTYDYNEKMRILHLMYT